MGEETVSCSEKERPGVGLHERVMRVRVGEGSFVLLERPSRCVEEAW